MVISASENNELYLADALRLCEIKFLTSHISTIISLVVMG